MSEKFFLVFLATILVTRLFLYIFPLPSPTIKGFRMHHWMFGLIGVVIGIIFHSLLFYAIGLGLFVDELTYLLIGGKIHEDNYSKISLFGTVVFIIIVFIFKDYLIYFI